jgi:hypothetical protein
MVTAVARGCGDTCIHQGPSPIDYRTLQKSGPLPLAFLRGVGLPDMLIDYLPSLLNQAMQHYSCFISYSFKDQEFADRLYADLQNKGVRCWFAPHDMRTGEKILDSIDDAIRLRDKVLLILSKNSIKTWAGLVRRDRNIGDFRRWQEHAAYKQSFERMLRDLTKEQPAAPAQPGSGPRPQRAPKRGKG